MTHTRSPLCVFVAAHNPESLLHAQVVFLAVVFGEFAPIARDVARKKVHRTLPTFFESGERSRRGDQLSKVEQGFSFSLLHGIYSYG
jgi:hypothetical protein